MSWIRACQGMAAILVAASIWGCSQEDQAARERTGRVEQAEKSSAVDGHAVAAKGDLSRAADTDAHTADEDHRGHASPSGGEHLPDATAAESAGERTTGKSMPDDPVVESEWTDSRPEVNASRPLSMSAPPAEIDFPGAVERVSEARTGSEAGMATRPISHAAGHAAEHTSRGSEKDGGEVEREPLFVDWPEPTVALVVTGRQTGYLEPCGCSGLETQNGGLVRRDTLLKQLTRKGWPVVPIDAGNQVRRFGRQAEIKFQITVEGLRTMGYEAVSFGPDDLQLPAPELVGIVAPQGDEPSLFVSANVEIFDPSFTSQYRVVERGGKKIGITAVLGSRNQKLVNNNDVTLEEAAGSIREVWPELEKSRCNLYVLICHATVEESLALAETFPQFQLVITTGGAGEPERKPRQIPGTDSQMIQVGTKGMFAGVVGLFDDPAQPLRYQRIPLDSRFPDSKEMLQLFLAYQDQIKSAGFEGLGIKPQPMPGGLKFVGSEACRECHGEEYKIWKKGLNGHKPKHAHAYATIQHPPNSRGGIPRNFDPECISCHVVGWNPQKYFPYESGFLSLEKTPHLTDVGCENCHGPGSKHVFAENGDAKVDSDELEELRAQMWLDLDDAEEKCLECHDLDNSPAFHEKGAFDRYWRKIAH